MIYIVTSSDNYYPCAGAEDWEFVTRDLDAAKERAAGICEAIPDRIMGPGKCGSVIVLAIDEDNLHVQQILELP
jgi:hypothetical protein